MRLGVVAEDALVDDLAVDERVGGADDRVEHDQHEEDGQQPLVGGDEGEDAAGGALGHLLVLDRLVTAQRAQRREAARTHHEGAPSSAGRRRRARSATASSSRSCSRCAGVEPREQRLRRSPGGRGPAARAGRRPASVRPTRIDRRSTGSGCAVHEPGRLEGVDHGRGRARHDLEAGGELADAHGLAGARQQAQGARLTEREAEGLELAPRRAAQTPRRAGQQLRELGDQVDRSRSSGPLPVSVFGHGRTSTGSC